MALKLYCNIFRLYSDRQLGETKWEAKDGPLFKLPFQHVQIHRYEHFQAVFEVTKPGIL